MKYFSKKRYSNGHFADDLGDNDPMGGVANLFDVGLVFIVGLIITVFSAYHLEDLFDENSEVTIMKKNQNGEIEIITKKKNKIEAVKVTKKASEGQGQRLGVAYQLDDGSMVYVPD